MNHCRWLCLAGTVALTACLTWDVGGRTSGAPIPSTRPEREVPLSAIYTTTHQDQLRPIPFREGEAAHRDLEVVKSCLKNCHLSTLFLVRGDDPGAAIRDARHRLTPDVERETRAERKAREASTKYWLVLFLETGPSTPNQWTIRGVELFPNRVQVNYNASERTDSATTDLIYYLYWIPLGELKPGRYTVQLSDTSTGDTHLLRTEQVGGATPGR